MTDSTLNRFLAEGTNAQRLAFTPSAPSPASGPTPLYIWYETDTTNTYAYNVGTTTWIQINSGGGGGTTLVPPQGRLTLVTGVPVMTSDQTAKTTIYWTPYLGNQCPIFGGSTWSILSTNTDITYILNTTSHLSSNIYDLFMYSSGGVLTLGTGPAWTNSTTRSNAIAMKNGIWTNNASITLVQSNTTTTIAVGANQATYVGTIYATANGQTGVSYKPSPALGGTNNILGVYNAYNRINTWSQTRDSTASWSYTTNTWRAANNSNSNRITWIDGLGQSFVNASYQILIGNTATAAFIGIGLDTTTGQPTVVGVGGTPPSGPAIDIFDPSLGLHFAQAMEAGGGAGSTTYYGNNGGSNPWMALNVRLDM